MRILVTGVTSSLGAAICKVAIENGIDAIGTVRSARTTSEGTKINFDYVTLDLEDERSFRNIPEHLDAIVHVASLSEGAPDALMQSTGIGTWRLIQKAEALNIPKIIHISSMSVYGCVSDQVVGENTNIRHSTPYGVSKWAAECYLQEFFESVNSISIRCPAVVGVNSKRNFLARIAKMMECGDSEISLSNPNFLFNNIVHIDTLAAFVIKKIKDEIRRYAAFPVASSDPVQLSDVVAQIAERFDYCGVVKWIPSVSRPFSIDFSKAIELGFIPISTTDTIDLWLSNYSTN
jgi:UDP-glucose 4-epimerase